MSKPYPFMQESATSGYLNDRIRERLAGTPQNVQPAAVQPTEKTENLLSCAVATVKEILHQPLDKASLDLKLGRLFEYQQKLYNGCNLSPALRKRQYIGRHGLVMSPDYCITTQKDSLRVRAFIRAINHAVTDLHKKTPGPLHIVYPACGPLAPLLLPLIAYYLQRRLYSEHDLQITLIDMQPGAVGSLYALVNALQITPFIRDIQLLDGCTYETSEPIHIVVLEAMQHGFSREGHLALARHFASRIEPEGVLIPREVKLRAVISEGQREYNDQWQDKSGNVVAANMSQKSLEHRIELGEILSLTAENLRNLPEQVIDEFTRLITCGTVTLPELPDDMQHPLVMICTQVITGDNGDGQEVIGEYDSGITHPLPDMQICINFIPTEPKPGDLLVNSGDQLIFYYRLNGLPGFMPAKA